MIGTCTSRDELYKFWHESVLRSGITASTVFETYDESIAFCVCKDWIQDTSESLLVHHRRGFSSDPPEAYLEFYGVMQGAIVLQDAVEEMLSSFGLDWNNYTSNACRQLRNYRTWIAGHPVYSGKNRDRISRRCSIPRGEISYKSFKVTLYEKRPDADAWQSGFKAYPLGQLIDAVDAELSVMIDACTERLRERLSAIS